ncbi:DUF6906 family protein [Paenibacillus mesophilus]|uniref:DUF6906 family protein n=1 Tax=Paenibacillus mesophilus TaxID=2582849 RepID=UPI003B75C601
MALKNGKRPTLRQKIAIGSAGKDPNDWLVSKVLVGKLVIVHKNDQRNKQIISA